MAVDLSDVPWRSAKVRMLDFGGELTPPLGGAVQRINRLGSRFAIDVALAPVAQEPEGRELTSLLRQAKTEGALFAFPQPGLAIGSPGAPVVDGAVAGGTTVPISGLTPNYAIRRGQFVSFIHDGRRYLHSAAEPGLADAAGDVELTIEPMLRIALADGDEVEVARPMLEGLLEGGDLEHEIMTEPFIALGFSISESE